MKKKIKDLTCNEAREICYRKICENCPLMLEIENHKICWKRYLEQVEQEIEVDDNENP